jgi:hypothetical protein
MESIMSMLRGQIDEERAKVRPQHSRWVAGGEGPLGGFDPHGPLARKILSKKKQQPPAAAAPTSKYVTPRRRAQSEASTDPHHVDVVVEPQCGALWGNCTDSDRLPPESSGGGALWGAPPDEREEARKFQAELARLRGQPPPETEDIEADESETVSNGGALWGPLPDEAEEAKKFQREVARIRGEPPPPVKVESEEQGVETLAVEKKKLPPTAFTYFDRLVTRDILDGSRHK